MSNHDLAAGDDLAAILAIPLFLQRPPREKTMSEPEKYLGFHNDENYADTAIEEKPPTLEELLTVIRKMTTKRDELTETIRILKKQAEGMLKKL